MRRIIAVLLMLCMFCSAALGEEWLIENNTQPQPGSIGGEWTIIALSRNGAQVDDEYYKGYLNALEQTLISCGGQLSSVKYTEFSRTALALAALGENPMDFRGFDLLAPLKDIDKVKIQGNNGPIWALIALDSYDYEGFKDTRSALLKEVLSAQNEDGGYGISLSGEANPDMTAMAITALAAHQEEEGVADCLQKAIDYLIGYEDSGGLDNNCETTVWLMIAYCSLNMQQDADRLYNMIKQYEYEGGYRHILEQEKVDVMATEQVAYGMAAYARMQNGKNRLFDMRDVH